MIYLLITTSHTISPSCYLVFTSSVPLPLLPSICCQILRSYPLISPSVPPSHTHTRTHAHTHTHTHRYISQYLHNNIFFLSPTRPTHKTTSPLIYTSICQSFATNIWLFFIRPQHVLDSTYSFFSWCPSTCIYFLAKFLHHGPHVCRLAMLLSYRPNPHPPTPILIVCSFHLVPQNHFLFSNSTWWLIQWLMFICITSPQHCHTGSQTICNWFSDFLSCDTLTTHYHIWCTSSQTTFFFQTPLRCVAMTSDFFLFFYHNVSLLQGTQKQFYLSRSFFNLCGYC